MGIQAQEFTDNQGRKFYIITLDNLSRTLKIGYRDFSNTAEETLEFDFRQGNNSIKKIKFRFER